MTLELPGAMTAKEPDEAHSKESRADSVLLVAFEPLEPAVAEVHVPWDFSVILALKCSLFFFLLLKPIGVELVSFVPQRNLSKSKIKTLKRQGWSPVVQL